MKRISVLGVELRDYPVKESMKLILQYLNSGNLDTVAFLTTGLLLEAKDNEELKNCIEMMDMTVPVTMDILNAAGVNSRSREKEIENNMFLKELLRRLAKDKKKIFLLGETENDLIHMREALLQFDDKLTFFGSYAYENLTGEEDAIINEINNAIPDVVISTLSASKQVHIISENKMKVNARVWISLTDVSMKASGSGELKRGKLHTIIDKTIFRRMVTKYENSREGRDK